MMHCLSAVFASEHQQIGKDRSYGVGLQVDGRARQDQDEAKVGTIAVAIRMFACL